MGNAISFSRFLFAKPFIANKFVRDVLRCVYYQDSREEIAACVSELFNMSMKENLIFWAEAIERAEDKDNAGAIEKFSFITEPFARIYYNMAAIYLRQRNITSAETYLTEAIKKDPHMAIAYFLRGAVYLQLEKYYDAIADFNDSLIKFRGNLLIDYKQLGMQHKLYACEVHYNLSYAYVQLGNNAEALKHMKEAKKLTGEISEGKHSVISSALDSLLAGRTFQPYKLPNGSPLYTPPRSKTENLERKNFLGHSKVVSSVQHNDSYTGFVGIQDKSPNPSPSVSPRGTPTPVHRTLSATTSLDRKPPKPSAPPPQLKPVKKTSVDNSRTNFGHFTAPHTFDIHSHNGNFKPSEIAKMQRALSPPMINNPVFGGKPTPLPKKTNSKGSLGTSSSSSDETSMPSHLTIKVHYKTTRALRVASDCSHEELVKLVCKKFDMPHHSLSLWYKRDGKMTEITDEFQYKMAKEELEDGVRLVLWAQDSKPSSKPPVPAKPSKIEVLRFVRALYDYSTSQSGDLSFQEGDQIAVTGEINEDWLEGKLRGATGIFPRTYVENI